jgi:two-component system response regulator HydG
MNKILVVDDEQNMVEMLERTLEREGYTVEGATTREEALEKMENEIFPIVILDIKFPDTSGQELLTKFKEINPLVNVIMITGYSTIKNVIECIGEGAVDYFTKPLDTEAFVESVNEFNDRVDRWNETLGMG